jgi:hypothetical protein
MIHKTSILHTGYSSLRREDCVQSGVPSCLHCRLSYNIIIAGFRLGAYGGYLAFFTVRVSMCFCVICVYHFHCTGFGILGCSRVCFVGYFLLRVLFVGWFIVLWEVFMVFLLYMPASGQAGEGSLMACWYWLHYGRVLMGVGVVLSTYTYVAPNREKKRIGLSRSVLLGSWYRHLREK